MSAVDTITALRLSPFQVPNGALPGADQAALAALRQKAKDRFDAFGLPNQKLERWKYTNLTPLAKTEFMLPGADAAAEEMPTLPALQGAARLVFINGMLRPDLSDFEEEDGLTVLSLTAAIEAEDGRLLEILDDIGTAHDEALAALNTALMNDGFVVTVAPGTRVTRPLHIIHAMTAPIADHMRNLVVAGEGARLTLVETYLGSDAEYWTNGVTQIFLKEGAELDHYKWQREGAAAFHTAHTAMSLAKDARYDGFILAEGARLARQEIAAALAGEGARCHLKGVSLGTDRQHLDTTITIDHRAPRAESDQAFESVLAGGARSVFQGLVKVAPGADGTDARQKTDSLLLDRSCEADAKPELEIFADDVRCSHGATVGELDASKLFYLRSRGLDEAAAKALLIQGFVNALVDRIEDPIIANHLRAGANAAAERLGREGDMT